MIKEKITGSELDNLINTSEVFSETHYSKSISAIVGYLIAKEKIKEENVYHEIMDWSHQIPPIPNNLETISEQIDFIIENSGQVKHMIKDLRIILNKVIPVAYGLFGYKKAMNLAKISDISVSLNLEAIRGERGAFDLRLHSIARPYKQQEYSANNVLRMLENTEFSDEKGRFEFGFDQHPRCQDAISLRATPQTHGGARDVFEFVRKSINDYLSEDIDLSTQLRYALDLSMVGLADIGNISERRAFRLNDYNLSYGLPTNLVFKEPGYNHGFPVLQAVGTAVLGELKTYTLPTKTNFDDELNKSLLFTSAKRFVDSLGYLSKILTIELMMSCQGIDLIKLKLPELKLGKGTQIAYNKIRKIVDVVEENRYLVTEMNELDKYVLSGDLIIEVEKVVGYLK